jgi:ActR/RegA family two-component response regulator
MGRVVALMDDLFFQMKLAETAKHLGVEVKVATTVDALLPLLDSAPKLLIVDLNSRSQPIAAIERLRAAKNGVRSASCRTCRRTWLRRLAPRVAMK